MAYTLVYVIFYSNSNVKGTDIVPLPSRVSPVSSGDTVTSKLQYSDAANSQYLSKNIQICEHNEIL